MPSPSFPPASEDSIVLTRRVGLASDRRLRLRRRIDRLAAFAVTGGGLLVIGVILAMLVFIGWEAMPLLHSAKVVGKGQVEAKGREVGVTQVDELKLLRVTASTTGEVKVWRADGSGDLERYDLSTGAKLEAGAAPAAAFLEVRAAPAESTFYGVRTDGRIAVLRWTAPSRESASGPLPPEFRAQAQVVSIPGGEGAIGAFAARADGQGGALVVAQREGGPTHFVRLEAIVNDFTGESEFQEVAGVLPGSARWAHLVIDSERRFVYGVEADDQVLHSWSISGSGAQAIAAVPATGAPITALSILDGDHSLLLGRRDGSIEVWLRVREDVVLPDGSRRSEERPRAVRSFLLPGEEVRAFAASSRSRTFAALGVLGGLGLYNSTAERTLWVGRSGLQRDAKAIALAPREDALFVTGAGFVDEWSLSAPHASASFAAFFLPIHYERQREPTYTWQSSSADDSYEPKLSLMPLIWGTLKGTFFALFLAVPLAVLAALYTSQFVHFSVRDKVKPIIEIMASLPSVVLGFVAALWLAPRVENVLPGLILAVFVVPLAMLLAHFLWMAMPAELRRNLPRAGEVIFAMIATALGLLVALSLSEAIEAALFGGDFREWLRLELNLIYDQRNALIIALGMGFAVIPVVYTISEDAFSNVPKSLALGSRALGATRWQTVAKVVFPSASPGVFSAIMIGFGRAVGETMIVLMATGNTPIMDWNPFNGFRTLSANIAVELPEAAHHSTLYRTLFLSAFLLFLITFTVNTLAEIVRERLRKKFGRL